MRTWCEVRNFVSQKFRLTPAKVADSGRRPLRHFGSMITSDEEPFLEVIPKTVFMMFVGKNINTKAFLASLGKFGQKSFASPKICLLLHLCSCLLTCYRWCSRDRNLRDRDQVKISRWDRDFRLQNLCILPNKKKKMSSSLLTWIFFKFLAFFRCVLVVSYLQIQQKKYLNYRNFNKPFLCNIQSLETWNSRDRDET